MITIEKAPQHVLAIRLSGVVEESDVKRMEQAFAEQLESDDRFGLVVDMTDWSDITGDAIAEDSKFEFGLLGKLARFPRMALISDKQFPRAIASWLDPVFPTVEIRTFGADAKAEAVSFASSAAALPESGTERTHGVRMIDTGNPGLVAFEMTGVLTTDDAEQVIGPLQAAFDGDRQVDVFARVTGYRGFDPSMFVTTDILSVKLSAIGHIRRYAIVGAPKWMRNVGGMMLSALPMNVRFFDSDDEDDAWTWLKSPESGPAAASRDQDVAIRTPRSDRSDQDEVIRTE